MKQLTIALLLALGVATNGHAQETESAHTGYDQAAEQVQQQLREAVEELDALRSRIAEEKIPLSRRLNELENELSETRAEYQRTTRTLDSRSLDLSNLRGEIKTREEEAGYLSNLLSEYLRNFESGLHISELQRYEDSIETAKLAPENRELSQGDVFEAQAQLLTRSLDRLEDALGGTLFDGTAVDSQGIVNAGRFALIGPIAVFRSDDGGAVGLAEQRLGSLEPTVIPFADPAKSASAATLVHEGEGVLPADTTLGNAHKMEATNETFEEHVKKGGPVMIPIFAMAGLALLIALYKWLRLAFLRKPSKKKIRKLMAAVGDGDFENAEALSARMKGPLGRMLKAGVEHLDEPRELVEEVMYEQVLTARLQLNRMLPFIAICAAAAPLMGLLGTVTGIINTFKMITVFGSGDVKSLSGGISEALITTKFGLIVAIPSLLLHAFLSRKARGVVGEMETAAVGFVNQVGKAANRRTRTVTLEPVKGTAITKAAPDPELVRRQVNEIVSELLGPLVDEQDPRMATVGTETRSERDALDAREVHQMNFILSRLDTLWTEAQDIWSSGGWAMIAIAVIAGAMFGMGLHIWFRLRATGFRAVKEPTWRRWIEHPLEREGRVGKMLDLVTSGSSIKEMSNFFDQLRVTETLPFERDLKVMKICVSAAPLVGLLGTVTGMLATFGALSSGSGGDKTMSMIAEGISEALITTETGLVIALPGLFFQYQLERGFEAYKAFLAHLETACQQSFHLRASRDERAVAKRAARSRVAAELQRRLRAGMARAERNGSTAASAAADEPRTTGADVPSFS